MIWKIFSFPIRLILFLIVALLSGILFLINNTVILLLNVASVVAKAIGVGFSILLTGSFIISYVTSEGLRADIPIAEAAIFLALLLAFMAFSYFLPNIIQYIYAWIYVAAVWLWGLAKTVLFCRNCF